MRIDCGQKLLLSKADLYPFYTEGGTAAGTPRAAIHSATLMVCDSTKERFGIYLPSRKSLPLCGFA